MYKIEKCWKNFKFRSCNEIYLRSYNSGINHVKYLTLYVPHKLKRSILCAFQMQLRWYAGAKNELKGTFREKWNIHLMYCVLSFKVPSDTQWSLSSTVVTVRITSLTFNNSTFCPHSVFMCFVRIREQTAIISLYSINWLAFITETECVYCAVRPDCIIQINIGIERVREKMVEYVPDARRECWQDCY